MDDLTSQELQKRVHELEDEVSRLRGEVAHLSIDSVTGIPGRGVFEQAIKTEYARATRYHRRLGFLMIDIDYFKKVNDEHGHRVGDEVLGNVAQTIKAQTRGNDVVARYGGEEIIILTDGLNPGQLAKLAERIRMSVEAIHNPGLPQVTISIGVSTLDRDTDSDGWDAVKRADQALYRAKHAGRNRVEGERCCEK